MLSGRGSADSKGSRHLAPSHLLLSFRISALIPSVYLVLLFQLVRGLHCTPGSCTRSSGYTSQRPPTEENEHESDDGETSQESKKLEGQVSMPPRQRKPKLT